MRLRTMGYYMHQHAPACRAPPNTGGALAGASAPTHGHRPRAHPPGPTGARTRRRFRCSQRNSQRAASYRLEPGTQGLLHNNNVVEDEEHVLFHCLEYDICRQEFPELFLGTNMNMKNILDCDNQETIAQLLWNDQIGR